MMHAELGRACRLRLQPQNIGYVPAWRPVLNFMSNKVASVLRLHSQAALNAGILHTLHFHDGLMILLLDAQ